MSQKTDRSIFLIDVPFFQGLEPRQDRSSF